MKRKKLAIITSTRAEYGLLYPLIKELMDEKMVEMHLLVSGTHLLDKYGRTIQYIYNDGIPVKEKIPIMDESFVSDETHVVGAAAKAALKSCMVFARERYDAVIVLGDRYELMGFCTAAALCRIPIMHIHGGEITEGAVDDKVRHAVTKLSSVHFPSIGEYARRIIQMGENPERVYTVGALGIDNIMRMQLLDRAALFQELGIMTNLPVAAVTYHPVTNRTPMDALEEIRNVLDALLAAGVYSVITMPNSDVGGDLVYQEILRYATAHTGRMVLKKSLGQLCYLSLLKNADIMAGNSSSGIIESASFGIPAVNIGDRQKGRVAPKNVIHCPCSSNEIKAAIQYGLGRPFLDSLKGYKNPYGDGRAAQRIREVIMQLDFSDRALVQKKFYDIG